MAYRRKSIPLAFGKGMKRNCYKWDQSIAVADICHRQPVFGTRRVFDDMVGFALGRRPRMGRRDFVTLLDGTASAFGALARGTAGDAGDYLGSP